MEIAQLGSSVIEWDVSIDIGPPGLSLLNLAKSESISSRSVACPGPLVTMLGYIMVSAVSHGPLGY